MSALRIEHDARTADGIGVGGEGHVYDDLGDETPRGFSHDVQEADTARLQAMLDAFEDGVYGDGGDSIDAAEGVDSGVNVPGEGSADGRAGHPEGRAEVSSVKPVRMHADRQTTRPMDEQVREYRAAMPHLRVRGRNPLGSPPPAATLDPIAAEGVQFVPGLSLDDASIDRPRRGDVETASLETAPPPGPWLAAMDGPVGEWWGRPEDATGLTVAGRRFGSPTELVTPAPPTAADGEAEEGDERSRAAEDGEETYAADGTMEETYADDSAAGELAHNLGGVLDARRAQRRHASGLPSLDPLEVIALDGAFSRGEVAAGEVEPRPARGGAQVLAFDDDDEDDDHLAGGIPGEHRDASFDEAEAGDRTDDPGENRTRGSGMPPLSSSSAEPPFRASRGVIAAPGMSQGDERGDIRRRDSDGDSEDGDAPGGNRTRGGGLEGDHMESAYDFGGEGFAEEDAYEYMRGEERYVAAGGVEAERSMSHGRPDLGAAEMFFTGGSVADSTTGQTGKWGSHEEVEEEGVVWFEADAEGIVSPNPWPGEVRWGGAADGAGEGARGSMSTREAGADTDSDSEWSDADSEERGYWGTEGPAPPPGLADWLVSNNQTSLEEVAARDVDHGFGEGGGGMAALGLDPESVSDAVEGHSVMHGEGRGEPGPLGSATEWGWGDGPAIGSGSITGTPMPDELLSPFTGARGGGSSPYGGGGESASEEFPPPPGRLRRPPLSQRRSPGGSASTSGREARASGRVGGRTGGGPVGGDGNRTNAGELRSTRGFSGRAQLSKLPLRTTHADDNDDGGGTRRRRIVTKPPVPTQGNKPKAARPPFKAGKAPSKAPPLPPWRGEARGVAGVDHHSGDDPADNGLGMGISGTGMTAGLRRGGGGPSGVAGRGSRLMAAHNPFLLRHHPPRR